MPQQAWSNKRERQYEHIKDSVKERGASTKAQEIAARTVNKERARRARRGRRRASRGPTCRRVGAAACAPGTKRPKGRTKEQLYNEAKRMGIDGRSTMTKQQLQRAVDRRK